jgi:glycerol 3-phosphatase-2
VSGSAPSVEPPIIDRYDAALFDLDGVVYLGPDAVPGAADGLARLRERGAKLGFVTNNAARPPSAVAKHLRELGIATEDTDVVTSAQAGARLLLDRFGAGARVLVVGGEGIVAALGEFGLVGVHSADDAPVAVMQGYAVDLNWNHLIEAAIAIQHGAHWLATNTDSTRPTDRGIVPGNGAAVDAVRTAVDVDPEVAGKPFRPLIDETITRLNAQNSIFVGDRLDTDIAGAIVVGLDSLFVLSGAHGARELLAAAPDSRPTHLGQDLNALLEAARSVVVESQAVRCGATTVVDADGSLTFKAAPTNRSQALDGLWAAAHLSWRAADEGRPLDPTPVLTALAGLNSPR